MERKLLTALAWLVPLCLAASLLAAVNNIGTGQAEEELRQIEQAVRRAAVACYAAEGAYPPDLDRLREDYGLQVDEERYTVEYTVFAENLTPEITVLRNGG